MKLITSVSIVLSLTIDLSSSATVQKQSFSENVRDSMRYFYERTSEYYLTMGKDFVQQQLKKTVNTNSAKNAILFLGDGMSIPTLAATRMYIGGEDKYLSFEKFPYVAMSKTYCVDQQVADSACSSTAYLSGVKANYGTIGVGPKVKLGDCLAANDKSMHTQSIAQWAIDAGKSVGIVTTTRITHATPAGVFAHSSHRDWESNIDVIKANCDDRVVDDIAEQLVQGPIGSQLKLILGCGTAEFLDKSYRDDEGNFGRRTDKKHLINEWLSNNKPGENRTYVWNKEGLRKLSSTNSDAVLGLFAPSHCNYNYEIDGISDTVPTLTEMATKAVELLSKNENGYFLLVEGGRIDMAHHDTTAHIALDETAQFSKAIERVTDMVNEEETLIVVTADHSHTMTLVGYPKRGSNIFGTAFRSDVDNLPYLKLSYANGKGYYLHKNLTSNSRMDPTTFNVNDFRFESPTMVPREQETHGGDDVSIYVTGPWSHLFTRTMEQNVIPHIMAYATCIGDGFTSCQAKN